MTIKKIHVRLEQLINSLTIKENHKTFLRARTNDLYDDLNYICQRQQPYWLAFFTSTPGYALERFWYGGSFDRGIFIKNRFDIDMYLVYKQTQSHHVVAYNVLFPWNNYQDTQRNLTGGFLFELLYSDLKVYQSSYRGGMKILKEPPYGHTIPIRMDYQNVSILFDCIPAIEKPNGYLVIPSGMGGTKKVNPNLEEQALSKLNKEKDGKITKLILLIKYWNFNWGKPVKGYVLERLVEHVFDEIKVHTWDRAVKTFFSRAINVLAKKRSLPDRVYAQYSILDEYSNDEIEGYLEVLREADLHAHKGEWKELFNDI